MPDAERPLVVGAGPVGLGAALFLTRRGQAPRVVEQRTEPTRESRALAVNPRTLDLLEPTGVTRRMLEEGRPIRGTRFYRRGRVVGALAFAGAHPRYPFMLGLSQAATERLLAGALEEAGGGVERGVELVGCRNAAEGVEATLEPTDGGPRDAIQCPWLLGADGAHSTVRAQLGIGFPGSAFGSDWHLADAPLRTELARDHGHVFFLGGGGLLVMIPVVDPTQEDRARDPVWRVVGNFPGPLSWLVRAEPTGPPVWASRFTVAHRLAPALAAGNVYLAGDAAHLHSPVGARGMNLGLEDAWVFAELARTNRLGDYDRLRRPVNRRVVRRVELISRIAAATSPAHRLVRRFLFPAAVQAPFIRSRMVAAVTGLDHALPDVGGRTTS